MPSIAGLTLWIPQLAVAGSDLFTTRIDGSPLAAMVLLGAAVVGMVLGIWTIVLMCHTVAEVQGFRSAWARKPAARRRARRGGRARRDGDRFRRRDADGAMSARTSAAEGPRVRVVTVVPAAAGRDGA